MGSYSYSSRGGRVISRSNLPGGGTIEPGAQSSISELIGYPDPSASGSPVMSVRLWHGGFVWPQVSYMVQ